MATQVGPLAVAPLLPGGASAQLQVAAAGVIKASAGILVRVIVQAPGSAGSLTLNDASSVGSSGAGNQIITIAFSSLTIGQQLLLEWPCGTGITVSAITTTGVFSISYT